MLEKFLTLLHGRKTRLPADKLPSINVPFLEMITRAGFPVIWLVPSVRRPGAHAIAQPFIELVFEVDVDVVDPHVEVVVVLEDDDDITAVELQGSRLPIDSGSGEIAKIPVFAIFAVIKCVLLDIIKLALDNNVCVGAILNSSISPKTSETTPMVTEASLVPRTDGLTSSLMYTHLLRATFSFMTI